MLARPDTKVRGRFCVKRCGPSHRRLRTASAVLKNFVRQPEKTFSTVSAQTRHADAVAARLLLGDERTWLGRGSKSENDPKRTQRWSGTIITADRIGSSHALPGKRCYRDLLSTGARST